MDEQTIAALKQLNPQFELCPVCACCEMDTHFCHCYNCEDGFVDETEFDPIEGDEFALCAVAAVTAVGVCITASADVWMVRQTAAWQFTREQTVFA